MGPTEFERHAGAEMSWNWDKLMPATIQVLAHEAVKQHLEAVKLC
jgi:hypothetical protein